MRVGYVASSFIGLSFLFCLLLLISSASLTSAAFRGAGSPASPSKIVKSKCIDCWAGYGDVSSSTGAVTGVSVGFVVPGVTCPKSTSTVVLFVAEVDGTPGSTDSAYAGINAYCSGTSTPTYAAVWYDNPGRGSATPWNANAGDQVSFSIVEAGGNFTFELNDSTQGKDSRYTGFSASGDALNSAFCGSNIGPQGLVPQTKYSPVSFSDCTATIDGITGPIGGFGHSAALTQYVCYDHTGTKVLAKPSKLVGKSSFTVTWKAAGP